MGRFLVIIVLVASATTATTVLRNADARMAAERKQTETTDLALAREAADAAHTAVLSSLLRGGQINTTLPVGQPFDIDGRGVRLERYETRGDTVFFTVAGMSGASEHRISSSYLINDVDFPGPLWVDAPYATATVDPASTIEGLDAEGNLRATYLDFSKLYDYRLDNLLSATTLESTMRTALSLPVGTRAPLNAQNGLDAILDTYGTPTLVELYGDILAAFSDNDVTRTGLVTLASDERYGQRGSSSLRDARLVRIEGDLTVPPGRTLEGNGVLLVEGNLVVEGTLRWDGLVYVRSFEQELAVNFSTGTVEIRGSLVAEQEAPPPGGHMDLTIYRDTDGPWNADGTWTTPSGEVDMYSNGWTRHTHRSERFIPDRRVVLLDRDAGNPHEAYTRLAETLNSLASNAQVFFEFDNVEVGGLSNFSLGAEGTLRTGSVNGGFGGFAASPVLRYQSRPFRVDDVDQLVIDVRSLRLLKHHFDDEPTTDPEVDCTWDTYPWSAGCVPLNWPRNTKWLYDRGGAFRVNLYERTVTSDRLLYEAVFYWHRRGAWDTAERDAEVTTDQQWRDDIQNGMGYGTSLTFGPNVTLDFDQERLLPAMRRLGYSSDNIRHLASAARNTSESEQKGLAAETADSKDAVGITVGGADGNKSEGYDPDGTTAGSANTSTKESTERLSWWDSLLGWWNSTE